MNTVTVDIDRKVHAPVETTRRTVLSALSRLGFSVEKAEGGRIHAVRGEQWLGGFRPQKRPVRVDATLVGDGAGTALHLHLSEGAQVLLDPVAARRSYQPIFRRIHDEIDTWLEALDPQVVTDELPEAGVRSGDTPALRKAAGALRHVGAKSVADRLGREAWVWIFAPDEAASMSMNDAEMCLAVASMITADHESLPASLMQQLERVTLKLSCGIENATPPLVRVDVELPDKKVIELLYQQAQLRQGLPVREVQRCRDCTQEKIVNPDYRQRAKKNKWVNDLLGVVGISIGPRPQVFAIAGRLLNLKKLAPPDFVCARCQGTEVDVALATMCPQCHAIRREPLLLLCPAKNCGFDFRSRVRGVTPWGPLPAAAAEVPAGASAEPPAQRTTPARTKSRPARKAAADWYPDPLHRHQMRYYDGAVWTAYAADNGAVVDDPLDTNRRT